MRRIFLWASCLLVLAVPGLGRAADPADDFFFKKGDRVVFLGDSITEQYQYSTLIELYLTTRFPKSNMFFLNAGISGDTATGGAMRFADHILKEKPAAVTIDFGMNDGGYGGFDKSRNDQYVKNTKAMLDMAKKADVRVALISPNAVETDVRPNLKMYLETQKEFYAPLRKLAEDAGFPFVDQYDVTRQALEKMTKDKASVHPFPDGVHTNPEGGLLMAHTILVGLHAPALVSRVEIEAGSDQVKAEGCKAANVKSGKDEVSFDREDHALPMPILSQWAPLLPYVNQLKDLNLYALKVTGLNSGKYEVLIDGKPVAKYAADELAEGVNLGNLAAGPAFDQSQMVFDAINKKNNLVHQRFRGVMLYSPPAWVGQELVHQIGEKKNEERARLLKEIETAQTKIYELAQPTSHRFEIKAVK